MSYMVDRLAEHLQELAEADAEDLASAQESLNMEGFSELFAIRDSAELLQKMVAEAIRWNNDRVYRRGSET